MDEEILLSLWGKSDKENPVNYHPLLFHLLDVGFAARALWRLGLPPILKAHLADTLSLSEIDAEQVCTLLAAQHDLGKASAFQFKPSVPNLPQQARSAGFSLANPQEQPHGYVTARILPAFVKDGISGWQAAETKTRILLARITGGHHGTFPGLGEVKKINSVSTLGEGDPLWNDARRAMLEHIRAALFPEALPVSVDALNAAALVPLVGGFVSVADWIGSSKKHFPPVGMQPIAKYQIRAEEQARRAVQEFGWSPRPKFAVPAEFAEIFRFAPNPMQKKIVEWADAAKEPYLLIVEAAMGEGKTEGALYAVDRALTTSLASGFFLAMPTQATGNAMFLRVLKDYLQKRGHGGNLNFQLIHGGSFLSDVFDTLKIAANSKSQEDEESAVVAQSWFTHKKQALLAPFGVGTIDQSLMGVLQTKHWFVRLFGLAGKVVVFDEVHAYDVYMSALLGRLLGWLRALGCTVILLSATLPQAKRRELIEAWGNETKVPEAAYPRVTIIGKGGTQAVSVQSQTVADKNVCVFLVRPDLTSLAQRISTDLPDGGCAAVICNTVDRAQEAYRLLKDALGEDGWSVRLFHARTTANWRNKREHLVLRAFGKKGIRPRKAILVATSVIEQSLDLDFDWMASDIAPIDLLLQRIGRLWRHHRPRRPVAKARLMVFCGTLENGLPDFPEYADVVYDRAVLLRSYLALPEKVMRLPAEIESLVKAVYDDPPPANLSEAWQAALAEAESQRKERKEKEGHAADLCMVSEPNNGADFVMNVGETTDKSKLNLLDDEDPKVHKTLRAATRLGDPSVSLVCSGVDADGRPLAAEPKTLPTPHEARQLLGFALSLSSRGVYHALIAQNPPVTWQDSPFLRFHRVLHFVDGESVVKGHLLRLSREFGLEIEKENKN